MGDAMKADGAFVGQDACVTPLIGKLRLHIQGYVDKEDFFISPLKHEDVILGAPWFDRLAASIKFPEKRISFKFREKNMYIDAQESGNTIPLVHTHAFDKSIKSSISVYMIFVKDSLSDVNKTQVNESGSKEDLELSKFLNQFQDVFIDDIPGELPPKRGDDDHAIELIPGSSPPNKPPYRVSQAQQEEIMRQVNELVEKGMTKFDRGKQPGLLQPLPIPDSPWESISMDFIFGLPKSIHGNTGIWTIADRFSKQAHFIPVKKTIKAHQMATLFISQIFKYHGLPSSIVSDRDPRMTSNFWKGLFENLGTRLNFSSAYHPQTDGQSEIANLTILDLLKSYVTEVDQRSQWEKYLPLVEYAYNNTVHTSTGKAPFEVIEGRSKSPLLLKVHGKIFAADEYSRDLKESFQKIKEAISISQQKQKVAANKHRRVLAFKENDWVLLKFPKVRLRHTSGKNPTGHQKYYAKFSKKVLWSLSNS
ncbi:hypothetical protein L7F22_024622 [Adiantum nelumboides]|nr:hypothetical protein [Adiantum nelumboides]